MRRSLGSLAIMLVVALVAPGLALARQEGVATAVDLESREHAIGSALETARDAATRIRDPYRSTEAMARIADVEYDYDPQRAQASFERCFDLMMIELQAGGSRRVAARGVMEYALDLYAHHRWERAVDLTLRYVGSYSPIDEGDRYALAGLLARLGLGHWDDSPGRTADLLRRSLATSVVTPELAKLFGQIDSPDKYRLALTAVRIARDQRDGLGMLLELNDHLNIVELTDPVRLGDRSTIEAAAEWLQSVRVALERQAYEAARSVAQGVEVPSFASNASVRTLTAAEALIEAYRTWRVEDTVRVVELLNSLAASLATLDSITSFRVAFVERVRPPSADDLLRLADTAPTIAVADSLAQRAALMIAYDASRVQREQSVRSALAEIRSLARRERTADMAQLIYAEEAINSGRPYDATRSLGRVADPALRCQAAGEAALAVAPMSSLVTGDLVSLARLAAASARPTPRVVAGLLAACRASSKSGDDLRSLELAREALTAFDRIDYGADARTTFRGLELYSVKFGSARISPYVPVFAQDLALEDAFDVLVRSDADGLRLAISGVRSADQRVDSFLTFALSLLRMPGKQAAATAPPGDEPSSPEASKQDAP